MVIEIRKASRQRVKARIALAGVSGSGKTMGALLFAYGLVGDWSKIGLVDSENGSGELYAGSSVPGLHVTIGDYAYIGIEPPYTADKYTEALKAMEAHGCEAVIIDSFSHAWAGSGGLLDKQGKLADRTKNTWSAWRSITPEHNALVENVLRSKAHVIVTLRTKADYAQTTGADGKVKIEKLGMAPIQREGLEYEFTCVFDIAQDHTASCAKDRTGLYDGLFFKINPADGKKYLDWSNSGATPIARAEEQPSPAPPVEAESIGCPPTGNPSPQPKAKPEPEPAADSQPAKLLTPAQITYIGRQIKKLFIDSGLGGTTEAVEALICEKFGGDTIQDIPLQRATEILSYLKDEAANWNETVLAAKRKLTQSPPPSIDETKIPF